MKHTGMALGIPYTEPMKTKTMLLLALVASNLLFLLLSTGLYLVFGMTKADLNDRVVHLSDKVYRLESFILQRNQNISLEQFKRKHEITREREDYEQEGNMLYHQLLHFQFDEQNKLVGVE